jgi:cytosine/adenosine deaminase-related metal-dependent hydrolase
LIRYHADWVLPVSEPPLRDGWVTVEDDRITAFGAVPPPQASFSGDVDLGAVVILPGLVNAHTHLELSYLRGLVPPATRFIEWIRMIMAARRERPDPGTPEIVDALEAGIAEALRYGTTLVGDVSNTLISAGPLARGPLAGRLFYELIGFNAPNPASAIEEALGKLERLPQSETLRASLAAHAPYSVAPAVFRAICDAVERHGLGPSSVHLAEGIEEVEFLDTGKGPWRQLLEDVGAWDPEWAAPCVSPVEYLHGCKFLGPATLAVHGVQMTAGDLASLASCGTTLVTCPRSNLQTGAGTPPIEAFYRSGVSVAVGTDSLASSPDLNLFEELAIMRTLAPAVPAAALLDSATRQGARALGFDDDYGTLAPGKRARLLTVSLPPNVADVEEYLVSGISLGQIAWVR